VSKLYVVIQVCHEMHGNYEMDEIRDSYSIGLPFIFTDRDRAYREAEKSRKVCIPTFVKEFPFNPLDNRMEAMQKKMDADAEYIAHLEGVVKELEERLEGQVSE
jgi:hypothetical protein